MASPQTVWGIDVGKCALKALKLRVSADRTVETVTADYIEHAKIMSQPDADKEALWTAALEAFLSRNDISGERVVVGIPGQMTLARFSKLPPVEAKKIPDIVRYEADQQIPFDLDEVVWDYQVFRAPDSPEVEVGIFAVKRDLIRDHLHHFSAAGIEALAVQTSPLALYNAVKFDGALEAGTLVLVDIGTENTDLVVATDYGLWARTIPIGGNNFTDALVKSFKLSFNKAETLKRTAASSKYARQIFQAMRPVFADLVQELQRSIGFYAATHREMELKKMVGMGSAFKLPGLVKYLQQNLQLEVERKEKFERVAIPDGGEAGADRAGSFAVAYGLAVQGLGQGAVTSSLLPPETAKQVVWRKKRPFFAAAAACLVFMAGVIWMRAISDKSTLAKGGEVQVQKMAVEQAVSTLDAPPQNLPPRTFGATIREAAKTLKDEHGKLSNMGNDELKKIETITKLLENRAVWLRILAVIDQAVPRPKGALAEAKTAEAYAAAAKETARRERKELFVETMESEYLADVGTTQIGDEWNGKIIDEIANAGGQPRPGFIVTLRCRTPNSDQGKFVAENFLPELRKAGRVEKRGFYVNRVGLTISGEGGRGTPDTTAPKGPRGAPYGRGGGPAGGTGGAGGGGGGGGETPAAGDADLDPVTGESRKSDFVCQVKFDVVLQDLPDLTNQPPGGPVPPAAGNAPPPGGGQPPPGGGQPPPPPPGDGRPPRDR